MSQSQAVSVMIAIALVALGLMWIGWRGRQRRTEPLVGLLPSIDPGQLGAPLSSQIAGQYISSTTHGDWLDRVSGAGLGNRANGYVTAYPQGVVITRVGESDVFIPAESLVAVGTATGMAGKFMGRDDLVVITWTVAAKFGEATDLDSGFLPSHRADRTAIIDAVQNLINSQA